MKWLAILTFATLYACSSAATSLPGGYTIKYGDRGKAWLRNPDGTLAHGGVVKALYRDKQRILLVASAASEGGIAATPLPIDRSCYAALLFNTTTHAAKQISAADAAKLAKDMARVETYGRPCLAGDAQHLSGQWQQLWVRAEIHSSSKTSKSKGTFGLRLAANLCAAQVERANRS